MPTLIEIRMLDNLIERTTQSAIEMAGANVEFQAALDRVCDDKDAAELYKQTLLFLTKKAQAVVMDLVVVLVCRGAGVVDKGAFSNMVIQLFQEFLHKAVPTQDRFAFWSKVHLSFDKSIRYGGDFEATTWRSNASRRTWRSSRNPKWGTGIRLG